MLIKKNLKSGCAPEPVVRVAFKAARQQPPPPPPPGWFVKVINEVVKGLERGSRGIALVVPRIGGRGGSFL